MSQYNTDYKQPQGYTPQSHPQSQYSEFQQQPYAPPPYTQQPYATYNEHQPQYPNTPNYNQYGHPADTPQERHRTGANASYYNPEPLSDPTNPHALEGEGEDGEKGLGSTVVGGTAGGIVGHKMGGGWGTAAGAAIGAVGMNVVSHMMKKPEPAPVSMQQVPMQQVPVQQVPVQQVVAVPVPAVGMGGGIGGGMGFGLGGRIAQRRQMRRGMLGF